jgi:hypothetical protein
VDLMLDHHARLAVAREHTRGLRDAMRASRRKARDEAETEAEAGRRESARFTSTPARPSRVRAPRPLA